MDIRKSQLRRRRKACKKMKRKCVTLWKTLGIFLLLLAVLCSACSAALFMLDNTAAAMLGVRFWDVIDGEAQQPLSNAAFLGMRSQLFYQLTVEGSVLLINENVLPLREARKVCLLPASEEPVEESLGAELVQTGLDVSSAGKESYDAVIVTMTGWEELEQRENNLLTASEWKKSGKTGAVILLLYTPDVSRMEFLRDERYAVDACLWLGDREQLSTEALADIISGKVSPSGSLPVTACYEPFAAPSARNMTPLAYSTAEGETSDAHLVYQEGIYVGYQYHETRYEDLVMGTGNPGSYVYGDTVAFPFGHGLSYAAFAYSNMAACYNGETDQFVVTVTVTNTGTVAGKETVQIYSQSPYTQYDIDNKIEKPSVRLAGFGKTALLEPGAAETLAVEVDRSALTAFDTYGSGSYILDAGDYYLTVAADAHDAVNNILAAKGYTLENTEGRMDGAGDATLTYKYVQESFDGETYAVEGSAVTNQLSHADPNLYEGTAEQSVVWLSRSNWMGTYPSEKQTALTLTERLLADLHGEGEPALQKAEMPVMRARNGIVLQEMIGVAYDDPRWEQLLDQLSYGEMVSLIGDGFLWQMPVQSIHAPGIREKNDVWEKLDGLLGSDRKSQPKISGMLLAATFNTELAGQVGELAGKSCLAEGFYRLYISGMYVQRIAGGEGISEDSVLTGLICGAQLDGMREVGVIPALEGIALPASGRENVGIWLNEQAAREIYLKPLKLSGAHSVVTDSLRWGAVRSGGNKGLLTHIMQEEWDRRIVVTVDYVSAGSVAAGDGIAAGITSYDAVLPGVMLELWSYRWNPSMVTVMREACHRELYALANSAAMNGFSSETKVETHPLSYAVTAGGAAVVLWTLFAVVLVFWVRGVKKWKKSEQYLNYRTMKRSLKSEKKAD